MWFLLLGFLGVASASDQATVCLTGNQDACVASCNAGNSDSCKMKACLEGRPAGDHTTCNYHCAEGLSAACPEGCTDVNTCSALCLTGDVNACDVGCRVSNENSCNMKECLEGRADDPPDHTDCNTHCAEGLSAACPEGCTDATTCSALCLTGDVNACNVGCRVSNENSCNMKECLEGRAADPPDHTYCNTHCAQGLSAACPEGCTDATTCSALCNNGNADVCGVLCSGNNRHCKMRDCLGGNTDDCLLVCLGGVFNACPEGCTDATTCSELCNSGNGNKDACVVACHYGNADSCQAVVSTKAGTSINLNEMAGCIRGNQNSCASVCSENENTFFDIYDIDNLRGCSEEFQYCCKKTCVNSVYNNRIYGTPTNTASCKLSCKAGDTKSCLECLDDPECASGCTHLADMYKGSCGCEE